MCELSGRGGASFSHQPHFVIGRAADDIARVRKKLAHPGFDRPSDFPPILRPRDLRKKKLGILTEQGEAS